MVTVSSEERNRVLTPSREWGTLYRDVVMTMSLVHSDSRLADPDTPIHLVSVVVVVSNGLHSRVVTMTVMCVV